MIAVNKTAKRKKEMAEMLFNMALNRQLDEYSWFDAVKQSFEFDCSVELNKLLVEMLGEGD